MAVKLDVDIPQSTFAVTKVDSALMTHYALCGLEEKVLLVGMMRNPTLTKIIKARHREIILGMVDLPTDDEAKFIESYKINRLEGLMLQDLLHFFEQVAEDLTDYFPGLAKEMPIEKDIEDV